MPLEPVPHAQPPAGSVTPADLYIDRASRQMWLGVDLSVDPSGSLLVADLVQTLAFIEEAEADANDYTNTQILTRAPTVHTHTASQISDFNAAVDARIAASPGAGVPAGLIAIYRGAIVDIGVGQWADWVLCDGDNGTPDLRDKFVYGAGNLPAHYPPDTPPAGSFNVAQDLVVPVGGAHSHGDVTGATTLTIAQVPAHAHSFSDSFTATGSTDTEPAHSHSTQQVLGNIGPGGVPFATSFGSTTGGAPTSGAGAHAHAVTVNGSVSGTTGSQGSGSGHTHPINADPGHQHTVPAVLNRVRDALNWVALAYVMKVA